MFTTNKIAILLATYQGERFLREQIDSILAQSFRQWELFVHDDGSKDSTPDILQEYADQHPDIIHILHGAPTGSAKANFMYLMGQVRAPYYMFCDQDDIWLEDKIELTYRVMQQAEATAGESTPIVVFADLTVVDQQLHVIAERMSRYSQLDPSRRQFRDLMMQNVVSGCTSMLNRALAEKSLAYTDIRKVAMHDWWCALVAAYFGEIHYVDKPLILYRQHGDNSVGADKITSPTYIIRKLSNKQKIIAALEETREQIACFVEAYQIDDRVSVGFAHLGEKPKLERLRFYFRNDVKKCGFLRNLGLIVWG